MIPTLIEQIDFEYRVDLSQQIPWKKLNGIVLKTEELKLVPVICKSLYDELKTQKAGDTLTAENQTLLDSYIIPYVVEAAYAVYLSNSNSHSTISGMSFIQGDNTGDVAANKISELRKEHEYYAESYKGALVAFLDANTDTYPLYLDCCSKSRKPSFMFGSVESKEQKHLAELDKYIRSNDWQYLDGLEDGGCC